VSIDRGLDPREFTLVSFGGACSLHAGALAEIIGARDVLIPIHQGVFSAFGLMTADMRVDESLTASLRSDHIDLDRVTALVQRLRKNALQRIADDGTPLLEAIAEMRYLGQNYSTDIPLSLTDWAFTEDDLGATIERFEAEHRRLYGYDIPDEIIELVTFKVVAIGVTDKPVVPKLQPGGAVAEKGTRDVYFRGQGWLPTRVYDRAALPPGGELAGPAVIEESHSTTLVHPGQRVEVDPFGNLILHARAVA
jgi:N-methylhydantoinase A